MSILTGWNDPYALAEDQARAMNSMRASERDRIAFGEEEKNAAAKEAQRGIQQEYGVGELGALPAGLPLGLALPPARAESNATDALRANSRRAHATLPSIDAGNPAAISANSRAAHAGLPTPKPAAPQMTQLQMQQERVARLSGAPAATSFYGDLAGGSAGLPTPAAAEPHAPTSAALATSVPAASGTRSDRNNNPGNMVYNNYTASLGATGQDESGFAVFPSLEAGQAASVANLRNYASKGINTVEGVVSRWSPANGKGNTPESTNNYIKYVANSLGVPANQPLDMSNPQVLQALAGAIRQFEGTGGAPTQARGATTQTAAPAAPTPAPAAEYRVPEQTDDVAESPEVVRLTQDFERLKALSKHVRDPVEFERVREAANNIRGAILEEQLRFVGNKAAGGSQQAMSQLAQVAGMEVFAVGDGTFLKRGEKAPVPASEMAAHLYGQASDSMRKVVIARATKEAEENAKAKAKAYEIRVTGQENRATEAVKGRQALERAMVESEGKLQQEMLKAKLDPSNIDVKTMGMDSGILAITNKRTGQTFIYNSGDKQNAMLMPVPMAPTAG